VWFVNEFDAALGMIWNWCFTARARSFWIWCLVWSGQGGECAVGSMLVFGRRNAFDECEAWMILRAMPSTNPRIDLEQPRRLSFSHCILCTRERRRVLQKCSVPLNVWVSINGAFMAFVAKEPGACYVARRHGFSSFHYSSSVHYSSSWH
jgi:hypothetical protein